MKKHTPTTDTARELLAAIGCNSITVVFLDNEKGNPPGKLADAELIFAGGMLDGLRLIGFSVWERRSGAGRNVTFPARQYSVNGERRSFALLRPQATDDGQTGQDRIRDLILNSYEKHTQQREQTNAAAIAASIEAGGNPAGLFT